ncbi:MAG: transposase [Candidatus Muiribacteriota bacterium]
MARKLRIEYEGAFYHIITRGNAHSRIFKTEFDRLKFIEYLSQIHKKYGVIIHAYCLMGNHYHLFLETPKANLRKAMHKLNTSYTNFYNYHNKRTGHLFSGRYKAYLVEKDNYALVLSSYIHLNPVRANIVKNIIDYPWSSYKYYVTNKKRPDFLQTKMILNLNGGNCQDYKKFVKSQIENDFEPEEVLKADVIIGSDKFFKWIKKNSLVKGWIKNKDAGLIKKFYNFKTNCYENKENKIRNIFRQKKYDIPELSTGIKRKIIMLLLKKYTDLTLKEIGKEFEITDSAVSVSIKRFKKEMESNLKLNEIMTTIENGI